MVTWAAEIDTPPWTQGNTNQLRSLLNSALLPLYDAEWSFPKVVVIAGGDPPTRFESTASTVGTASTQESSPPQVSYLLKKSTGFVGRRYRGRVYLPAANEQSVNQDGSVSSGMQTTLATAAAAITSALNDVTGGNNTGGHHLLHSEVETDPTPVTALNVSAWVATQRRRLVRG